MTSVWTAPLRRQASANLTEFALLAHQRFGAPALSGNRVRDYQALWRWSTNALEQFWDAVFSYSGIAADRTSATVLRRGRDILDAVWFPDVRVNFAENLLLHRGEHIALIFTNESGSRRELSYRSLAQQVACVAGYLNAAGVAPGDVVAGYVPNLPEAVVAMLATTSLGGVWTSCSPDFGLNGILDRFSQVRPKVLFTADGYVYAGKTHDSLKNVRELLPRIPSIERVIVIPYVTSTPDLSGLPQGVALSHLLSAGPSETPLNFSRQPFSAPLYIMYSSGTTGVPKCIVHSIGGTLLQHRKEHLLHVDLKPSDRMFFFTTCGWMMWNWLISGLASGATLVLYDGSPLHPGPESLWRMAAAEDVTIFGTSPRYLGALEKAGYRPQDHHDLSALRTVLATASPLLPEQFDFIYDAVKRDVHLASMSGGTDILSSFCCGSPWLPVHRGEIQAAALGMATAVWNDEGHPLRGDRGELVCVRPFPSMPIGFWGDADGRRYRAAYFERFPGVWHHGDYAIQTQHDGFIILGRSDAVLNPGGVRIGTAEIYRQVDRIGDVLESVAIGQDWDGDVRVVLFVRLRPGIALDKALQKRICDTIRTNTSPRHVPARILAVEDIPRTLSGKIVELAIRNVVHGRPVQNVEALANPDALAHYKNRPELLT